jgi:flagellar hook-associated protein 2
MKVVQGQLSVTKDTDRSSSLVGDFAIRALQSKLQSLVTGHVTGLSNVQTLAEAGVKTGRDGSLSVDSTTFASALARDPAALDGLFSTKGTGLSDAVYGMVQLQTRAGDGLLTADQQNLAKRISAMDDQAAILQLRIDAFRQNLINQFTAMESTVSNLKATGNFLTAQSAKSLTG